MTHQLSVGIDRRTAAVSDCTRVQDSDNDSRCSQAEDQLAEVANDTDGLIRAAAFVGWQ